MTVEFIQEHLNKILVSSGASVAVIIALVAACKKFVKPTPKGARKCIKYLIKYLQNENQSDGPFKTYTLDDISLIISNKELKWENDKK